MTFKKIVGIGLSLFSVCVGSVQAAADNLQACEEYALEAVTHSEMNRDRQCGFQGEGWDTSFLNQKKWCESVTIKKANAANNERAKEIARCLAGGATSGQAVLPKAKNNNMLVSFMIQRYLNPVTEWYIGMEQVLLPQGRALTQEETALARKMGLRQFYRVRVVEMKEFPFPDHLMGGLARLIKGRAAQETGRAMGFALLVKPGYASNPQLLAHLLGYSAQIEQMGHRAFLEKYAREVLTLGYDNSGMVKEAMKPAE